MASALSSVANATVVFHVPVAGVRTDPETGNVMPVVKDVEMSLFLKAEDSGPRVFPGVDSQETVYSGYAVAPQEFEAAVTTGTTGVLTFAGEAAAPCEVLELRLPYGNSGLIGGTLTRVLGEKVRLVARRY